ncbi:MAG: hypothetical protein PWR15_461 [Bacteroidota bacterium]|jgi:hypothetical protein|nr:hypothetical protein [Bacteroidota bacterium]MDK2969856.1 hypothetical protein [Bacteroidota bacterium]
MGKLKKTHADSLQQTENKIVNLQENIYINKYDNKSKTIHKMGWW